MGLRDFLQNMKAANQLTGGFAASAKDLAQTAGRDRLAKALKGPLGQQALAGDENAIAQLGAMQTEIGGNQPIEAIFDAQKMRAATAAKNNPESIDAAKMAATTAIEQSGANPKLKDALNKAKTMEDVKLIADQANKQAGMQSKENMFATSQGRLQKGQEKSISGSLGDSVESFTKKQRESNETIDVAEALLGSENRIGDGQALIRIVKGIGGEGGALSDQDINRTLSQSLGRKVEDWKNWVIGSQDRTLNPTEVLAMNKVLGMTKTANKNLIASKAAEKVQSEIVGSKSTFLDGDKFSPAAQNEIDRFNLVGHVKNGKVKILPATPQNVLTILREKNPEKAKQVDEAIKANPNAKISVEKLKSMLGD